MMLETHARTMERLRDPARCLHPLIGTPGFTLPDTAELSWIEVKSDAFPWLHVFGASPGNWLLCPSDYVPAQPLKVYLRPTSSDNVLVVGRKTQTGGDFHLYGRGGLAVLSNNSLQFSPIYLRFWSDQQLLFFGKNSTTNGLHIHIQGNHKAVVVGDDCMFSSGTTITNSDMHAIIDMRTGEQKNPPGTVLVEPHVWVGQDSLIHRNAVLGFGSVVGAKSVVTREVPRFVSVAGAPARVVSTNVTWDRLETPRPDTVANLTSSQIV